MSKERRRNKRFTINQLVKLEFDRESKIEARGVNISEAGVLCDTDSSLEVGTKVFLEVTLGDEVESITCKGIVRRTDKKGDSSLSGVEFIGLKDEDLAKIRKLIVTTHLPHK
ncbi:MAG: PilZ domain-containing protein [bacterium]|nr:PilZ domain-containing protein [bacterium]